MAIQTVEQMMRLADSLEKDELLEVAQRLIERARLREKVPSKVDVNALAGTLKLDEDPMAIQARIRS